MQIVMASELDPASRFCTCCKKPLRGKVRYLELDQRTGVYHEPGEVNPRHSQGGFPFGLTCAKALVGAAHGSDLHS